MKHLCTIFMLLLTVACGRSIFKSKWVKEKSPDIFDVRFETSKGPFDIKVNREWSPKAADRFYQLIKHGFYDHGIFYRVDSHFVAQFGISDTIKISKWEKFKVSDEHTIYGNKKGALSFARAGKESRGRELFINLADNSFLDTLDYGGVKGFPAFGMVTRGMDVVDSLYAGYGDATMTKLDTLYLNRQRFSAIFPKCDTISKAWLLKSRKVKQ